MERAHSRITGWLTAGLLAVSLAAVPLGTAEARSFGGHFAHGGGMPWVPHGGGNWGHGGWGHGGWGHGGGWNGWHGRYGHYGHYGYGYGYGWPFVTGLAAGALLSAPYGYDGYYDDYYGGPGYCRTVLVPRGPMYHRYYVRRTVCD